MNFNQLTNFECGQRNPLAEMASHVTQDYVFQDRMGETFTSELRQNNGPLPQSFRMDDLMKEINQLEHRESVRDPEPFTAVDRNTTCQYPNEFWAEQGQISARSWERNFYEIPQMTHFYGQLPQAMALPNQSYIPDELRTFMLPSSSQSQQIYNSGKYRVIESLDELDDILESNEDLVEHPKDAIQESECRDEETILEDLLPKDLTKEKPMNYHERSIDHEADKFIENNPMTEIPDLLQKGKRYLAYSNLSKAILCFEAAIKRDETCVEAWKLLGVSWAKSLENLKAVYALKRGLSLDPVNLDIIMELAIIYMKYRNKHQCVSMLLSWLRNHPEYRNIVPKNFKLQHKLDINVHKDIQNMFLKAAQRHPINPDYLVQSALGVLFNINLEFDKSIDCFHTAAKIHPRDASLWNLLGITLTESGKYEEGLDALHRALTLDANGLYHCNVGISYMFSKDYKMAVSHLLLTLNWLHRHSGNKTSSRAYKIMLTYLRLCMSAMGRLDMVTAVDEEDLGKVHKAFGVIQCDRTPMNDETAQKTD